MSVPSIQADAAGSAVSLAVTGVGGGTLGYSASGLPSGLSINASTGLISGTLGSGADADSPYDVTITVSNGTYSISQEIRWVVTPRLTLDNPGAQSNSDGDAVSLQLSSFDAAGGSVTYSASGLPTGLSVSASTGLISGTIGSSADASSPYSVTLTASDGTGSVSQTLQWTVAAPSIVLDAPGDQSNLLGAAVSLSVTASDGIGSSFTYSATGLPTGLSINTQHRPYLRDDQQHRRDRRAVFRDRDGGRRRPHQCQPNLCLDAGGDDAGQPWPAAERSRRHGLAGLEREKRWRRNA